MANLFLPRLARRGLHLAAAAASRKGLNAQNVISAATQIDQKPTSLHVPHDSISSAEQKDFFKMDDLFTLEDLFEARVHLGHKEGMLHPHMRPYIFGKRLGVLVLDLDRTQELLKKALVVTAEIAYRKGIILFMDQNRQTGHLTERAAKECGEYAHCRRWSDGILTDSTKKFNAVTRLPDLIITMSAVEKVNQMHRGVLMAAKMLIPTIGICDTNADPTLVTYPIPGNDDSPQSIELYCELFKQAILRGKQRRRDMIASGDLSECPVTDGT